jgi:serine/threonine protein kinase
MGAVYKAEHRLMERTVALKVIKKSLVEKPRAIERFSREVKAAAKLSHPNIVAAYDAEQAGDLLFLVMEYVDGVSLAEVVEQQGPLPVGQACDHVRQAALGLQHASERGMVHRDLKPHNLMRTPNNEVKILDFGLARFISESGRPGSLTQENAGIGTPEYIAPEQAMDACQADIRADIYSLGCTLYFLLTGRPPFSKGTAMQKVISHLELIPPPVKDLREDVPAGLNEVLDRMLAKKPSDRYQSPAEVAQALAPFVGPSAPDSKQPARPSEASAVPGPARPATPEGMPSRSQNPDQPAPVVPAPSRNADSRWNRSPGRALFVWPMVVIGLALIGGAGFVAWTVLRVDTPNGTLLIKTDDPSVQVIVRQNGRQVTIIDPATKQEIELEAGKYEVELAGKAKGLRLSTDRFTLTRNGKEIVTVTREPGDGEKPPQPAFLLDPKIKPSVADRTAAEWVLKIGGSVDVVVEDKVRHISLLADLPKEAFYVAGIRLFRNQQITIDGLANLKGLPGLIELNLGYSNKVGDDGLEQIKQLTTLQYLHLESTAVTDTSLDRVIKGLTNLRKLNLQNTGISDAGLAHLKGLTQLNDLALHYNKRVSDAGLEHLKDLKGLRSLHLEFTGITDVALEQTVKGWARLEQLNLAATRVSDTGIQHLQGLKDLRNLTVIGTRVTEAGAQKLKSALPNCNIVLK